MSSSKPAPIYDFVDDEGKLTGTPGTIVPMTMKEAAERSGIKISTVSKRVSKGNRRWSNVAMDVDVGRNAGRYLFATQTSAHFSEELRIRTKKRAHQERVREGNKDV